MAAGGADGEQGRGLEVLRGMQGGPTVWGPCPQEQRVMEGSRRGPGVSLRRRPEAEYEMSGFIPE